MSDVGEREGRYLGKVLWHVTMSLDGFISGPGNAMDWAYDTVPNETVADVIRTTGALIVGRRTYEVEDRDRGGFYGGGVRFYESPGAERVDLERIGVGRSGQTTNLRFRVAKP
jgi:hypothetical protein